MSLHNLLQNMDKVKLDQNPLPSHYIFDLPETEKDSYLSTLVASAILLDTNISENKNRLFNLFLEACHTKSSKAKLFDLAQKIDADTIKNFIRFASEQSFKYSFFVDLIVFLRLDSQVNQEQLDVLNQWVSLLDIDEEQVSACMYIACNVLGLKHQNILKNTFPIEEVKVWQGFSAQRLDVAILQKGLTSGYWYFDEDINIHKNWQVENSIIEFRNNSSLISDNETKILINNIKFINPKLIFNEVEVNIDNSAFQGYYDSSKKITAIKFKANKKITISNSLFRTVNCRAIYSSLDNFWDWSNDIYLIIDSCVFEKCGNQELMGGALCDDTSGYFSIKNSKFISCIAKLGGALRLNQLKSDAIINCYFERCLSLYFQKWDNAKSWNEGWLIKNEYDSSGNHLSNGGAIYCNRSSKNDSSVINNSKFVAANVYLGNSVVGDYHVKDTSFVDSVLTYYRYSSYIAHHHTTTFEKGDYKLDSTCHYYCKPLELDWIENYEGDTGFDARNV